MSISTIYNGLRLIALNEFQDVVLRVEILEFPSGDPHKVRLDIVDGSLLDIFLSLSGRYSYHWERRLAVWAQYTVTTTRLTSDGDLFLLFRSTFTTEAKTM